ncbi:MAG: alpha/beta hydrolase [Pseudomonadota bacterium]
MKKALVVLLVPVALLAIAVLWLAREVPAVSVAIPDDATDVLRQPQFATPSGWQWESLDVGSAGTVRWGHASPDDPKGLVVFLPGYSAPLNIYFESFSRMVAAGYAVGGLDWPSQGGSSRPTDNPQKIHAASLDGHVDAGLAVQGALREQYPDVPVFVVGLSMGAQLGTRMLAAPGGEAVSAAALITPAYGIYGDRPSGVERALLSTLIEVGLGERYAPGSTDWVYDLDAHNLVASDCSHPNARTRLWYSWMVEDPTLRVGGMSNQFVMSMVRSGELAASEETLSRISVPVWMPVAENDTFVDNSKAVIACDALSDCTGQEYAEARHCLFEESDAYYQPFLDDLIRFLDGHTGPAAEAL